MESASSTASRTLEPASMLLEARSAVEGIEMGEWANMLTHALTLAGSDTVLPKARAARRLFGALRDGAIRAARAVSEQGALPAAAAGADATRSALRRALRRARLFYNELTLYSGQRRTIAALRLLVTGVTALATAGGLDAEGGLPDTDLHLGLGAHRNIFSHTILIGLGSEISIRATVHLLRELYPRLPEPHALAWDAAMRLVDQTYEAGVAGVWLGLAPHFMKDAGTPWAATKPIIGLPPMPMLGHKVVYTVASLTSAAAGLSVAAEPADPLAYGSRAPSSGARSSSSCEAPSRSGL